MAFVAIASAGLVVTEQPATFELRDAASHPISGGYATRAACFAAAPGPGRYRCVETTIADIVGVCDEAPAPAPVVDAQGFTLLGDYAPHACPNEHFSFTQVQPVRDPYPSCKWVEKAVEVTDCDGKQVRPMIEGSSDTAQTDQTPGPWIEGVDVDAVTGVAYNIGDPCPEAAHGNCFTIAARELLASKRQ